MNDLDELADAARRAGNSRSRARQHQHGGVYVLAWIIVIVSLIAGAVVLARGAPDVAEGLAEPLAALGGLLVIVFVIALGVRIGLGGRR